MKIIGSILLGLYIVVALLYPFWMLILFLDLFNPSGVPLFDSHVFMNSLVVGFIIYLPVMGISGYTSGNKEK
jgi:hypothetical protein